MMQDDEIAQRLKVYDIISIASISQESPTCRASGWAPCSRDASSPRRSCCRTGPGPWRPAKRHSCPCRGYNRPTSWSAGCSARGCARSLPCP